MMKPLPKFRYLAACVSLLAAQPAFAQNEVLVVANPDCPEVTEAVILKIFLGKIVEIGGIPVVPVNMAPTTQERGAFLKHIMAMDEDKYTSYWTVRRYIGKGAPPREFLSSRDVIDYIHSTPGAIGYVRFGVPTESLRVLFKRP